MEVGVQGSGVTVSSHTDRFVHVTLCEVRGPLPPVWGTTQPHQGALAGLQVTVSPWLTTPHSPAGDARDHLAPLPAQVQKMEKRNV